MDVELIIQNGNMVYYPKVLEGIQLDLERRGSPGRLTFSVVKDGVINFQEGNPVRLSVDGKAIFYGYVFSKSRGKERTIEVTAYDQLRYLKNKDTYLYENKKASELVSMIAADFRLRCGEIEDTGYVILSGVEENQTLFDIIQNALDETLAVSGRVFTLYDECGSLMLRNAENMKLEILIDAETGESFSYTSSIDGESYNRVKLTFEDEKAGRREVYLEQDGGRINEWGVLQYFEKLDDPQNARERARSLLSQYNRKTRSLSVKNAFGDLRVRAGVLLAVHLDLGDLVMQNFMMVDRVTHRFVEGMHSMDLNLIGGGFYG